MVDVVVLEIEGVLLKRAVVRVVVQETDNQSLLLPEMRTLLRPAQVTPGKCKRFYFHMSQGYILCSGLLQIFDVGEPHSVAWSCFSTENCNVIQFDFALSITDQAERVLGTNEAKLYINTTDMVTLLKAHVQMLFAHHIHFRTVGGQGFTFCVACVVGTKRVKVSRSYLRAINLPTVESFLQPGRSSAKFQGELCTGSCGLSGKPACC